jgi:hypothetical protein
MYIYAMWCYSPKRIMTCDWKVNGCNWKISCEMKYASPRKTKAACMFSLIHRSKERERFWLRQSEKQENVQHFQAFCLFKDLALYSWNECPLRFLWISTGSLTLESIGAMQTEKTQRTKLLNRTTPEGVTTLSHLPNTVVPAQTLS